MKMKLWKRALASLLCLLLVGGTSAVGAVAAGETYAPGDRIAFGSYPQSQVKDAALIAVLESVTTGPVTTDEAHGCTYADLEYNGVKYRKLTRTTSTIGFGAFGAGGYTVGTYYFKYEPIVWRVLSENDGTLFVVAEYVIDTHRFHPQVDNDEFFPTWADSEIRSWLNDGFYDTAFTAAEQSDILTTALQTSDYEGNDGGDDTEDKVFLLDLEDVLNPDNGFIIHELYEQKYFELTGLTSYSFARGVTFEPFNDGGILVDYGRVFGISTPWLIRSPGETNLSSIIDFYRGEYHEVNPSEPDLAGVRPALRLNADAVGRAYTLAVADGVSGGYLLDHPNSAYDKAETYRYYAEGQVVDISTKVPVDKRFDGWTGAAVADASAPATTITMPGADTALTPNFTQLCYLEIKNGSGSGYYAPGTTVNISFDESVLTERNYFHSWDDYYDVVANVNAKNTTVTMPDDSTSTITVYTNIYSKYKLTVYDGSGSGYYLPGETVQVVADAPETGKMFDYWLVISDDLKITDEHSASTSVVMPSDEDPSSTGRTIYAKYKTIPTYPLTVPNGSGSGYYAEGATVIVAASAPPEGYVFDYWSGRAGNDSIQLADPYATTTTFTMPANYNVQVWVVWKRDPAVVALENAKQERYNLVSALTDGINLNNYTPASVSALYDQIAAANAAIYAATTVAAVNAVPIPNASRVLIPKANKTALTQKMQEYAGFEEWRYTPETAASYESALATASAVSFDVNATQAQVDAALSALITAHANLHAHTYGNRHRVGTHWELTCAADGDVWAESFSFFDWILFIICFGWIWM
ncbi:MAG: DUF6273 domain-containing protein [Oscillospiraceae bacterium]|nr:DUF6273 domain-containing protein [Oscillospiraceae bacterium]